MVTMGTLIDERYCYWDESYVVFKVKTGEDEYAATEPISVAIMPNPKDGLTFTGLENTATFRIKDTVVVDGRKRLTDSLGCAEGFHPRELQGNNGKSGDHRSLGRPLEPFPG